MKITRKYKKRGGGSGMSSEMSSEKQTRIKEIEVLKKEINDKETELQKMIDDYGKAADDGEKQTYDDVDKTLHVLMKKGPSSTPRNHLIGEIKSRKIRLKIKEDKLNELNTKGGKRKNKRKTYKKGRKIGGNRRKSIKKSTRRRNRRNKKGKK